MQRAALILAALGVAVGAAAEAQAQKGDTDPLDGLWWETSCQTALEKWTITGDQIVESDGGWPVEDTRTGDFSLDTSYETWRFDIVFPGEGENDDVEIQGLIHEWFGRLTAAWNEDGTRPANIPAADTVRHFSTDKFDSNMACFGEGHGHGGEDGEFGEGEQPIDPDLLGEWIAVVACGPQVTREHLHFGADRSLRLVTRKVGLGVSALKTGTYVPGAAVGMLRLNYFESCEPYLAEAECDGECFDTPYCEDVNQISGLPYEICGDTLYLGDERWGAVRIYQRRIDDLSQLPCEASLSYESCEGDGEASGEGNLNEEVRLMLQGRWYPECMNDLESVLFDESSLNLRFGNPGPELTENTTFTLDTSVQPYTMDIVSEGWCTLGDCGPACDMRRAIFSIGDNLEGEGVGGENHLRIGWNYDGSRPANFDEADEYYDLFDVEDWLDCAEGSIWVDLNYFRGRLQTRFDILDLNGNDRLELDEWDWALTIHCVYDANEDGAVSRAEVEICDGGEGFCEREGEAELGGTDPRLVGDWSEAFCGDNAMDGSTFTLHTIEFHYGNIVVPDGVKERGTYSVDTSVSPNRMDIQIDMRCVDGVCEEVDILRRAVYEYRESSKGIGPIELNFGWNHDGSIPTSVSNMDVWNLHTMFTSSGKCEGDYSVNVNQIAERRLANFENLDGNADGTLSFEEAYLEEIVFWLIDINRDGFLAMEEMNLISEGEDGEAEFGDTDEDVIGTWYGGYCADSVLSRLTLTSDTIEFKFGNIDVPQGVIDRGTYELDTGANPKRMNIHLNERCIGEECKSADVTFHAIYEVYKGVGEGEKSGGGEGSGYSFSEILLAWNHDGSIPEEVWDADEVYFQVSDPFSFKTQKCEGEYSVDTNVVAARLWGEFDLLDTNEDGKLTVAEANVREIIHAVLDLNCDGFLTVEELSTTAEGEAEPPLAAIEDIYWYNTDCDALETTPFERWYFYRRTLRIETTDSEYHESFARIGTFKLGSTDIPEEIDFSIQYRCSGDDELNTEGECPTDPAIDPDCEYDQCESYELEYKAICDLVKGSLILAWNEDGTRPADFETADVVQRFLQNETEAQSGCTEPAFQQDWYVKSCGPGTRRISFNYPEFELEYEPAVGDDTVVHTGRIRIEGALLGLEFERCGAFNQDGNDLLLHDCLGMGDENTWWVEYDVVNGKLYMDIDNDLDRDFSAEGLDEQLVLQSTPFDCTIEVPEGCTADNTLGALFGEWTLGDCELPTRRWTFTDRFPDRINIETLTTNGTYQQRPATFTVNTSEYPNKLEYVYDAEVCGWGCTTQTVRERIIWRICGDTIKIGRNDANTYPVNFAESDIVFVLEKNDGICQSEGEPPFGEAEPPQNVADAAASILAILDTVDSNGDSMVSLSESGMDSEDFDLLDRNGDGHLNIVELRYGAGALSPYHDADLNRDGVFRLSELLRVIQFYNARGYTCDANSEDGYGVWLWTGPRDTTCPAHASDFADGNGLIDLSELLRLVQLYNIGGYEYCAESGEDRYCAKAGS